MFTSSDKWLFKIISFITLVITVLVITLLASGHTLTILDFIQFYSLPLGVFTGWAIITIVESKKK